MVASLNKIQTYVATQYVGQISGTALTVTVLADDYLWISQILATTNSSISPLITEIDIRTENISTQLVFNPISGEYNSSDVIEIFSTNETATIYYTIDGSDPTNLSTEYTAPIQMDAFTIKAIAYDTGIIDSDIFSATYTLSIIFEFSYETNPAIPEISLSYYDETATIYYTIDGSDPTNLSTEYTAPIQMLGDTLLIKAVAYKDLAPVSLIQTNMYINTVSHIVQTYIEAALKYFYVVRTLEASEVTAYTVQLNGTSETFNPPALYGPNTQLTVQFEYAKNSTFTNSELSFPFIITELGNFYDFVSVEFTDFYYFRAIATDGVTTWYGAIKTFLATDYYYQELGSIFNTGTLDGVELVSSTLRLISGNLTGNRISPELSISELNQVSMSLIKWTSSEPSGTEIKVEIRISIDSGVNWLEWEEVENEEMVFSFFTIEDFSDALFQIRQTLTTETVGITPTLSEVEVFIADGHLSNPIFNPIGGDYYVNQYISLSCPTEDSQVFYTLDGSEPDKNSTEFTVPILIQDGLTIRAVSYLYDEESLGDPDIYSPVITHTYNIIPFPESELKIIYGYRFRNDDGDETTATWKVDENINLEPLADSLFRMRLGFSGQEDVGPQKLQLDYRIKPIDGVFTDWRIVPGHKVSVRITETGSIRILESGITRRRLEQ